MELNHATKASQEEEGDDEPAAQRRANPNFISTKQQKRGYYVPMAVFQSLSDLPLPARPYLPL